MIFASVIHDPLAINLGRQKALLLSKIPQKTVHYDSIYNSTTTLQLLSTLSSLLSLPAYTQLVATLFRPILIDLCARWLEDASNAEQHLIALCYLLEVHEELFPILSSLLAREFKAGPLAFINDSMSPLSVGTSRLQQLVLSYYRLLQANRELPNQLWWSLAPLSTLMWTPHLDNGVRLLAIRCYALQSGMGEKERSKIEREILGEPCGVECQLNYGQNLDGSDKEVDGWLLTALELRRIQKERDAIVTEPMDYFSGDMCDGQLSITLNDLCPFVVNIHGVLLKRSSIKSSSDSPLISLPSTVESLRNIALQISSGLPILLTSSPSAGKSLLLTHLSKLLHPQTQNQIVTIHLADTSLDPRSLLGSYVSSAVNPGVFEWKEGVLVRAMRQGKWIVFEDVDKGSNEVLGVIKPLVESLNLGKWIGGRAQLIIPGREKVVAHSHFTLFATRSLLPSRNGGFPAPTFFGSHKFSEVTVQSPSTEELRIIVDTKYPRLNGSLANATISLWDSARKIGPHNYGRDIGLRELQKFCQRIENIISFSHQRMDVSSDHNQTSNFSVILSNPSIREDMYTEARDIFFGAGTASASSRVHAAAVARVIGDHLGLEPDRQKWILHGKIPEFNIDKDANGHTIAVQTGRTRLLARAPPQELPSHSSRPFVLHKPALSLISRIATAISHNEPVLLTGETGTGKTSIISHLASLLHRPLISLNLSHQTESSDLIGGLKPIDPRIPGSALQERFLELFGITFSRRKNEKFESEVRKAVNECKWKRAVGLWKESVRLAMERIRSKERETDQFTVHHDVNPRKKRKTERAGTESSEHNWSSFLHQVEEFDVQHVQGKGKFAFGFVEGPLVKALRSGDWILLDEVNLASPETLESIAGVLHGPTASITLTEHGSLEPVPRHPDFRLFACMNPATDVGKKDLPPTIRSRFTEIDVPPPDADKETLLSIVSQYIGHIAVGDKRVIMDVAEFYSSVKSIAENRQIADGANHRPHFSMRTLVRALTFASDTVHAYGLRRSVWEGCLMAFTMALDGESAELVTALAKKHLLSGVSNPRSLLAKDPTVPASGNYVKFGPFLLEKGYLENEVADEYIITPSVERKLVHLSRIILTRRFPVLIEGPTSSGKTSSIEYLAKRTGHRFVRINNHEHTDIQEYLGSYISDPVTGKLVFKDGLLVQALRQGDWIVLDELNLAPTDVLEALNRLLDDNRELVIPETQEVVRPHPHFMLFATQNPPGLYAGRKVLSRAFRNRFLEVHFDDVPQAELETILCQRCQIAPSYGKKIVTVFHELQKRRQSSRVFESKQGFATLRDLFRWAGRDAVSYQELADNGYMLLAERSRRPEDKLVVKEVIEAVMGVRIDEDNMYNLFRTDIDMTTYLGHPIPWKSQIIWTKAMQRLYILVCRGLKFNEPILLVGETGSGKTSVCQIFAEASSQQLITLNCHQNTETADIIGGLRPVRNRASSQADAIREASSSLEKLGIEIKQLSIDHMVNTITSVLQSDQNADNITKQRLQSEVHKLQRLHAIFEWHDGPLLEAMNKGDVFLLDEISLADDSVLERLNSVLEPGRSIVLAERGGTDSEQAALRASDDFKLLATMNPGGDYGKKELSPALRNRFTEIWVPSIDNRHDLELIVGKSWQHKALEVYTGYVLDFVEWLCDRVGDRSLLTLRDILAWIVFTNSAYFEDRLDAISGDELFHHAAHMSYLDGLSSLPQLAGYSRESLSTVRKDALDKLQQLVPLANPLGSATPSFDISSFVQLGSFAIPRGSGISSRQSFNFNSPTTLDNAMRVVRACQVHKPILLEGSPGVGKTSLITALANLAGHTLCRINLSDQTDLIDLFGSDLPVEGGTAGEFAWKDAEFLQALQLGHWVLLDEMNLAPQAVLEGLNAILDHRGTVYIPELNRSFRRHPSFRIFAAQNPLNQGGGRKGLPKSFVNRFTKVYIEELVPRDLFTVCAHVFPDIDEKTLEAMISFNIELNRRVTIEHSFGQAGSPWEFNLRDIIRWGTLVSSRPSIHPSTFLDSVYLSRFRSLQDRSRGKTIYDTYFPSDSPDPRYGPTWTISDSDVQFGHFTMKRGNYVPPSRPTRIVKMQLPVIEALGDCVSQSWLAIVTGAKNSGKTNVVRTLAHFSGNMLWEISINSATDTMDILGSFEQVDIRRRLLILLDGVMDLLMEDLRSSHLSRTFLEYQAQLQSFYHSVKTLPTWQLKSEAAKVAALASALSKSESNNLTLYEQIHGSLSTIVSSTSDVGQFEWVDGPLIRAMKLGHWLLLDGANLCGPSVLDRLNSLCEPNGSLTLSERGFVGGEVQQIKPHPNFRLFMSVDPHYGELSRAMRNRGVEIAIMPTPLSDDKEIVHDYYRLPLSLHASFITPNSLFTNFEAIRRGIVQTIPSRNSPLVSTGHALDQDSALANLVDHIPALIPTSIPVQDEVAWVYFLSKNLVPAYMPHVVRYLCDHTLPSIIREFIHRFPSKDTLASIQLYKQQFAQANSFENNFVSHLPLYFYWMEGVLLTKPSQVSLTRPIVLELINLAASMFISERDAPELDDKVSHNETYLHAYRIIIEIRSEILSIGRRLLNPDSVKDLADVKLACQVLSFTTYLKLALSSRPYNFSAMHAMSKQLLDYLEQCPPIFSALYEQSKALYSISSLSNGVGLFHIWSGLYVEELTPDVQTSLKHVEKLAASVRNSVDAAAIRRQALSFMSLESLEKPEQSQAELLKNLRNTIFEYLAAHSDRRDDTTEYTHPSGSLVLVELYTLVMSMKSYTNGQEALQEIVRVVCEDRNGYLTRLIPYQHLYWATEVGSANPSIVVRAQLSWFDALWKAQCQSDSISGPSILFCPVLLNGTIVTCNMSSISLLLLGEQENTLKQQTRLALFQSKQTANRADQLVVVFFQNLWVITSCFESSYDAEVSAYIRQMAIHGRAISFVESFSRAIELIMSKCTNEDLVSSIKKTVYPISRSTSRLTVYQVIGMAWMGLARLLLDLTVPDTPIDPSIVQASTYRCMEQDKTNLTIELHLHRQLEALVTGNMDNDMTLELDARLASISLKLDKTPHLQSRGDISRLHVFWSEVSQFLASVLFPSKIDGLIEALICGDQDSQFRERVVQESLVGFYQRLDSVYPDFADITIFLKLAIHHLRLGLCLVSKSHSSAETKKLTQWVESLLAFPPGSSSGKIARDFINTPLLTDESACKHVLIVLASFSQEKSLGLGRESLLPGIEKAYEQIFRLWSIDRTAEKKMNDDANSLYRQSKLDHTNVTDAELEEAEFLALFPNFEGSLDGMQHSTSTSNTSARSTKLVQSEDIRCLLSIHHEWLHCSEENSGSMATAAYIQLRDLTVEKILVDVPEVLPEMLDRLGLPFQFSLLRSTIAQLDGDKLTSKASSKASYNFYSDANFQELKDASSLIVTLRQRLHVISEEWPDQMVIKHLIEKCDDILKISSKSSVAKILTMVEQLLVQSDDWQMYANRDNSIKPNQDDLVHLIVRWRRLELLSWQGLLDSQAEQFNENLADWWFRMYDVTVRGVMSCVNDVSDEIDGDDKLDTYIETLVPLLEGFITSSPLGQFHNRMRLLSSFESYICQLSPHKTSIQRSAFERVCRVLHSTYQYYNIFSESLSKLLMDGKGSLEAQIRDLIKLASWKDINVQALKQSAHRTHKQLYKIVKKYRDLLQRPVVDQLLPFSDSHPQVVLPKESPTIIKPSMFALRKPKISSGIGHTIRTEYILNLSKTFDKFKDIVEFKLRPFINAQPSKVVEDTILEIITTSKELSSFVLPSALSKELRLKHQKALLVRKRKAYSDLLKELKNAGLASKVKSEVLVQNSSSRWIREQPTIPKHLTFNVDLIKAEQYFLRLSGCMPSLRESLPNHHSDITTRDLYRGELFLESAFSLAISLRSQLVGALDKYQSLENCLERVQCLASSGDLVFHGGDLRERVSSISSQLHKLLHGLTELQNNVNTFYELQKNVTDVAFSDEISSAIDSTNNICHQINRIGHTMDLVPVDILTIDENERLQEAVGHFDNTLQTITEWRKQQAQLEYLLTPLQHWLDEGRPIYFSSSTTVSSFDSSKLESLIKSLLVSIQSLATKAPEDPILKQEEEKYILKGYQFCRDYTHSLNLNGVYDQFIQLLRQASSQDDMHTILDAVMPFLSVYLPLSKDQITAHVDWTKAIFKLDFVLCSILNTLCQSGFCQPQEQEGERDEGEGESTEAGVGIGEGAGINNVSKEIQEESQIEGLKGEGESEEQRSDEHEGGDTIEMKDDFGGALEDVPDPGSEEENEADSDEESDGGIDETIGELDELDPSAADEKIWGDEKGSDDSDSKDEKADMDHSEKQEGSSEVVAKESKEKKKEKQQSNENQQEQDMDTGDADIEDEQEAEDEGNDDGGNPNVNGAKMDEHVQEANTLDLPEELDLSGDGMDNEPDGIDNEQETDKENEEDGMDIDDADDIENFSQESTLEPNPSKDELPGDPKDKEDPNDQSVETVVEDNQDGEQENDIEGAPEDVVARPDLSHDGVDTNIPQDPSPEVGENTSTGETGTTQSGPGQPSSSKEKALETIGSFETSQPADNMLPESDGTGSASAGIQQGQALSQANNQPAPNPLRSLGDALREIQKRFDEILSSEPSERQKEKMGESNTQSQLEYLHPDDTDQDMQALAPAGEEQVAKLNQLSIVDEGVEPDDGRMAMDIDTDKEDAISREPPREKAHTYEQSKSSAMQLDDDIEGAILQTGTHMLHDSLLPHDLLGEKKTEQFDEADDQGIELQLKDWRAADYPDNGAERIWHLYESLTHDLAYTLCEQLRLILEPTMATRLKGDYRTGKRLNMKKVIPYIASDYTKDKIWLRRTRPSQREYQVLISIDDSKSMAESHSVHLAYQTLALISKALSRLECGDVAIAKFGEAVDLLHGFDEGPFSDQAGTKVLNAFRFSQKATNVLSLLETTLKVLENSREKKAMSSSTAADLWQLQIIISDGMCQDHDKLRTILRKAEEQRVMVVFIILDSLHIASVESSSLSNARQASILSMDKAEFRMVDGKMELQLQKYLDSFPFEYYVVLRQVEALPEILSSTLKQFFERISEE